MKTEEQKLIDIVFDIGLTISNPKYGLTTLSEEERAKWIAEQLKSLGYDTTPCGMSWGVLTK